MTLKSKTPPTEALFAGIHISGPNNPKTALTILKGIPIEYPLNIEGVYEKIGAFGKLFSDERLVNILQMEGPFKEVFVDCPLTSPPCASCGETSCPGIWSCGNLEVAYILALMDNDTKENKSKKKKPFNPQSQRIWDVLNHSTNQDLPFEPTYSSNIAPLMIRSQAIQKRLQHSLPEIQLKETSVFYSLLSICDYLGLPLKHAYDYKKFETGLITRIELIRNLFKAQLLNPIISDEDYKKITNNVENFQSLITALSAALHFAKLSTVPWPSEIFPSTDGFVFTPKFD